MLNPKSIMRGFCFLRAIVVVLALRLVSCSLLAPKENAVPILINEFMAKNTSDSQVRIIDEYGDSDDWIELYNPHDSAVRVSNMFISDDSTDLRKFELPDTVLAPGGHLVIWADDDTEQGACHANFKLSAQDGEEIILSSQYGSIQDRIQFFATSGNPTARLPDRSYGRTSDGASQWCLQKTASMGTENVGCEE